MHVRVSVILYVGADLGIHGRGAIFGGGVGFWIY